MNRLTVDFLSSKGTINPNIYGHFAEHIGGVMYDGLWVGQDSPIENIHGLRKALIDSFKKINPPVLRWPGGCFAETYDWRDGIGPRDKRPERANWWYTHDKRTESNQMGTHEFVEFCRLVGAEPYFAANVTTVTPLHIRNWIEYCNFPAGSTTLARERGENGAEQPFNVRYWGIGNENWGGGGQMTPEMYAREYQRFASICHSLDRDIRFILCGANGADYDWTRRLMKESTNRGWGGTHPYGMSVHYYTSTPVDENECFFTTEEAWYDLLFRANRMGEILDRHRIIMDEFDPERKIPFIVDEWGCWHRDGSGPSKGYNLFEQQSTMRDAIMAALTLNIFNNRCDIVAMANVAQLCNNLHSLYLTSGEQFVETVNYHVFDLYKGHQGGKQLATTLCCDLLKRDGYADLPEISASASVKDGVLTLTLANLNLKKEQSICLDGHGGELCGQGELAILAHEDPNACNTFEEPDRLIPQYKQVLLRAGDSIVLPAASVARLTLKLT